MVEKIIVNPREVRGLGDVVSPKSLNDFMGYDTNVTSSTDSTYGTVYSDGVVSGSTLTLSVDRQISSSASSFSVGAVLKSKASGTPVISGATVYCKVNDTVLSGTTGDDGAVSFTVNTDGSLLYHITVYYFGSVSLGGCFANSSVVVSGTPSSLTLQCEKAIIQTGDTDTIWATCTDSDGEGVPFQSIGFYEEWTPGVRVSSEKSVFQSGVSVDLSGTLIDASDGSIVRESGHTVSFYQEATNGVLFQDSTEYTCTYNSGENVVLIPGAVFSGLSGFELSFDLKITVGATATSDCRFFIGEKSKAVPTNPQNSVFIGKADTNKVAFGYRTTSTSSFAAASNVSGSYQSMKISYDGTTAYYDVDDSITYSKNLPFSFSDFSEVVLGLVAWGTCEVKVKNIKLLVNEGE